MTQEENVLEYELDEGVAMRQAIGSYYSRPANLESQLKDYWAGELKMPPQPVWRGEVTSWDADPFHDRNWQFQHHTLRWLNPIRHAAMDGDRKAQREWLRVAKSWVDVNIPAENSPSIFAWVDMADGNRAIQLSLGAPLVPETDREWYYKALEYHRDWLKDPRNIVGRNHGLHQHAGLLVVGAVLKDEQAMQLAVNRMTEQFSTTFDEQGVNDEGSTLYHQHNIVWWMEAWERVKLEEHIVPDIVTDRLNKAVEVLAHLTMPNGELPQIGDASRGKVRAGLGSSTDFLASSGRIGKHPDTTDEIFDRGYIVARSGWGADRPMAQESHAVIRFGDFLRGHAHNDRGSLHLYDHGVAWLIDSGFYSYNSAESINKYLKSREAHNVAVLTGAEHDQSRPVELIISRQDEKIKEYVLLDHGYQETPLRRHIVYVDGAECWLVLDSVNGRNGGILRQQWHVDENIVVRNRDNGFRLESENKSFQMYWPGRNVSYSVRRSSKNAFDGVIGVKWKTLEDGTKLIATAEEGVHHLAVVLAATKEFPLSIVESRLHINGNLLVVVARGPKQWRIRIYDGELTVDEIS